MDDPVQAAIREAAAMRDQAIADANARYQEMVQAINTLTSAGWTVARKSQQAVPQHLLDNKKITEEQPQLTDAVRDFVLAHQGMEFTVNNAEAWLNRVWPGISPPERRATLSSILIRLATQLHEITVVNPGAGSRATIYLAKPPSPAKELVSFEEVA